MSKTIKLLSKFLSSNRGLVVSIVILGFLASLSEGFGIGLFIPLLQTIDAPAFGAEGTLLGYSLSKLFEEIPSDDLVTILALAIFGAILLKALLTFGTSFLFAALSTKTSHELRTHIFDEVLTLDFGTLDSIGSGRMLNVLSNESWKTVDAIALLLQAAITICTLLVYGALLLLISWKLTLIVSGLLALMTLVTRLVTRRVGHLGKKMTRTNAEVARQMMDGVSGVEVIRSYGREDHHRRRFVDASSRLARITRRKSLLAGGVYPIYEVLGAAVILVVILTSVWNGENLAPLLVFAFVLFRLAPLVKRLEKERVDLLAAEGAIAETLAIIERRGNGGIRSGQKSFSGLRDAVALERVSYRYEANSEPALENVSMRIAATGLTAIVGPSGAGKSTLVKVLIRFFDPTEGRILVDGVPLAQLNLDEWRTHMAVVPQKVFLFNATVRDNIAYGLLEADEQQVVAAAKVAGAHDFIAKLRDGYYTRLGEGGVELSGGEGQRICLARAMIRKPDILLLDEATNALDSISEERIQVALEELRHKCAVVVIAHRLATIEKADQIVVLDSGRLVEQGDLQQLISRSGLFAELYERQQF